MTPSDPSAAAPLPPAPGTGLIRQHRTARTVMALILREMSTRYGRSPGGYLWAILEPLGGIFILALGFSLLLRSPPLGTSFLLFYATGFAPFIFYQSLSNMLARALSFSRPLLFYPAVTWIDALLARFLLNVLTGIMVTCLVLAIVLLVSGSRAVIDIVPIVEAMVLAVLVGAGVGTLNCALNGLIRVWDMVWSIVSRPLFIASGVIFLYEDMPPMAQEILWYNPLMHVLGIMRSGFYPTYSAAYATPLYVTGFSLVCLFLGIVLLGRYHRDILNR